MSIYSDILFTRYFFTIVLSIVAVIMFLPTFMAFLQCVKNPSDAAKEIYLEKEVYYFSTMEICFILSGITLLYIIAVFIR